MLGYTSLANRKIGPIAEKKKTICATALPSNKMMSPGLKRKSPIAKGSAVSMIPLI